MSQVFIDCPETGRPVYVGLNYEWLQLDAACIGEQSLDCRECGGSHTWDQSDVNLRADGGG
jgi:hypothetical protein